jgi:hypothetical protein
MFITHISIYARMEEFSASCSLPLFSNRIAGPWNRWFPSPVAFIIDTGSIQTSKRETPPPSGEKGLLALKII